MATVEKRAPGQLVQWGCAALSQSRQFPQRPQQGVPAGADKVERFRSSSSMPEGWGSMGRAQWKREGGRRYFVCCPAVEDGRTWERRGGEPWVGKQAKAWQRRAAVGMGEEEGVLAKMMGMDQGSFYRPKVGPFLLL